MISRRRTRRLKIRQLQIPLVHSVSEPELSRVIPHNSPGSRRRSCTVLYLFIYFSKCHPSSSGYLAGASCKALKLRCQRAAIRNNGARCDSPTRAVMETGGDREPQISSLRLCYVLTAWVGCVAVLLQRY